MGPTFLDKVSNKVIGEILTDKGIITSEQLAEALVYAEEHGLRLGEALLMMKLVSNDVLNYAIAEQYGVLPIELDTSMVDKELINRFPMDYLKKHSILPLILYDRNLVVVISDPTNQQILKKLSEYVPNVKLTVQLSDEGKIQKCLASVSSEFKNEVMLPDVECAYENVFSTLCNIAVSGNGSTFILRDTDHSPILVQEAEDGNIIPLPFAFKTYKLVEFLEEKLNTVEFTHGYWKSYRFAQEDDRFIILFGFVRSAYNCTVIRFKAIRLTPQGIRFTEPVEVRDKITVIECDTTEQTEQLIINISSSPGAASSLLVTQTARSIPSSVYFYPKDFLDISHAVTAMGCKTIIFDYAVNVSALQQLITQLPLESHVFILYSKEQNPGYANLLRLFSPSKESAISIKPTIPQGGEK